MKLLLYSLFAILMIGCGTRKSKIDTYKVNVVSEEFSKVKIDSSEKNIAKVEEKTVYKTKVENDIKQKDVKTEIKEVFTDGQLTERTTITIISDKVDNSKTETNEKTDRKSSSIKETLKHIESTANKVVDSLFQTKSKAVDADTTIVKNVGGWAVVVLMALVLIASIWYWLKRS